LIKEKVKENVFMKVKTFMKVNGKMVKDTVKENVFMQMETYMKVNGKTINKMV
jgi:hypothetical protein